MALAEKRICEHTDATTISSADEFIVDSMANGTRNITMTNLENQILSTDTYSALTGIGDGTITGSIADIDSNLNNLTYDSTTNRLTMTGNTAFSGTIDSVPTAGSGNAVSSGGTKTYVDSAVSHLNDEIAVKIAKRCEGGTTLVERTAITDQMDAIKASGKNGVFPFYCASTNADFPTIGYCMCIGIIYNPGVSVIIGINSQTGEIWTNGNVSQNAGAWRGWKKLS